MKKYVKYVALVFALVFSFVLGSNKVSALEYNVTDEMTQAEIDAVMANGGTVYVKPGNYDFKIVRSTIDGTVITLGEENVNSIYNSLRLITVADTKITLIGNTTMEGNVTSKTSGMPVGIFARRGNTVVTTGSYQLIISSYTGGMRLGEHGLVSGKTNASLTLENAKVLLTNAVEKNESADDGSPAGRPATGTGVFIYGEGETYKYKFTVSNSTLEMKNNPGVGIYRLNYDVANQAKVAKSSTMTFRNSTVTIDGTKSGYSAISDESRNKDEVVFLVDNTTLKLLNNKQNGYTGASLDREVKIMNGSKIYANNNTSAGMKFDCSKLYVWDSYMYAEGNGSFGFTGMTNADVRNSTISTKDNKLAGMVFYGDSVVYNNSHLLSEKDGERTWSSGRSSATAVRVYPGSLTIRESTTNFDSVSGISFYNTKAGSVKVLIDKDTVGAITSNPDFIESGEGDLYDDWNSLGNTGRTIVIGGSLQLDKDQTTGEDKTIDEVKDYNDEINKVIKEPVLGNDNNKDEFQYTAPINLDNTALMQFILHRNVNKEVGGKGSHTFTYYDPHTKREYKYSFRYNELGEDLDPTVSGNAYVWTPVTIVRYDATEGVLVTDNTTVRRLSDRYAIDTTIYGNSLDLAERIMPTAVREGYVFTGWYVAVNGTKLDISADDLAEADNFEALYAILNKEYLSSTKALGDFSDVKQGVERITLYAKWEEEGTGDEFGPEEPITPPHTDVVETVNYVSVNYAFLDEKKKRK